MTVPDEAAALSTTALGPRKRSSASSVRQGRLRVQVIGLTHGDTVVDLTIPTNLVSIGVNLGARFAPMLDADATQHMLAAIEAGEQGRLLDLTDPDQDEHIVIWIE